MVTTIELEADFWELMGNRESEHWPTQAGYPGLAIKNLNSSVQFSSKVYLRDNIVKMFTHIYLPL